jgi:hypothetical protein
MPMLQILQTATLLQILKIFDALNRDCHGQT